MESPSDAHEWQQEADTLLGLGVTIIPCCLHAWAVVGDGVMVAARDAPSLSVPC